MTVMDNKINRDVLVEELSKELARRSYKDYFTYSHFDQYKLFRHIELICDELQDIIDGEQKFLIVEMPPRHGKSASITETFPSYYLMNNPDKEVMTVAYSEDLYKKFGRKNREKFKLFAPKLFGLELSQETSSASEWGVLGHKGVMFSTSILGGATGRGADLLIIDDPIKNRQDAESKTIREKIYAEWQDTFFSRLHAGGSIIVIMTRWHEDDLVGKLLREATLPWIELKLPAIAEEPDDLLGRNVGEPLCRELGYDEKWAKRQKKTSGSRTWASLYQQRPSPAGGNVFKRSWFKYYVPTVEMKIKLGLDDDVTVLPRLFDIQAQSWDCTFKKTEESDFVAGQVWARKKADYYLLDRQKDRMDLPETIKAIRQMTVKWPEARAKYIEDKANGPAVIQMLEKEISGMIPVNPQGGKEVRANAVAPLWEAGNVYVPHPLWKPGTEDMIDEMVSFPNAAHDDEVDSMTQCLTKLSESNGDLLERYRRL